MGLVAVGFGMALIVLGVGSYLGTDRVSITAMIPAFFGIPLVLLGLVALKDNLRKHAMHLASVLGLVGFLIPAGRAIWSVLFRPNPNPIAVLDEVLMAVLCGVFLALCVRSFIAARRRRTSSVVGTPSET